MKLGYTLCLILFLSFNSNAQFAITSVGNLPDKVSNNAVCEGYVNGVPHLFSFGGIDSTKIPAGIHLKSYAYNIETGISKRINDLPDTMGKIGAGASRIGNVIYIAGGYYVFPDFSEKSSNKMHRYDIENNVYLSDGADIPIATDDHVQVVWRDSLIYLITGWSDTENIPNTQIYNPALNSWTQGTSIPDMSSYKSFGASGTIINDTIYYFGGANSSSEVFDVQNYLRKGVINPNDPRQISWSISIINPLVTGYRMASTILNGAPCWIGGSNATYNFDGIAYDLSGGVSPSNRILCLSTDNQNWNQFSNIEVPMDLRGIASFPNKISYLAGGMLADQTVTNRIFKLEMDSSTTLLPSLAIKGFDVYPNPFTDSIYLVLMFIRTHSRIIFTLQTSLVPCTMWS